MSSFIDLRDDLDAGAIGKPGKAEAPRTNTVAVIDLEGDGPAVTRRSKLCANALSGLVNIPEIEAAAKYLPPMEYSVWIENFTFPMAGAVALAPQHEPELRRIFDETCRRTADL